MIVVAIPLGQWFELSHEHVYSFAGHKYPLSENFVVSVPKNLFAAMDHPDFSALGQVAAWKWVALIGIVIGIAVKFAVHLSNGVPLKSLFKPFLDLEEAGENTYVVHASGSAVFSNWIPFKRQLEDIGLVQKNNLVIDLSDTKLVDSSVMEKLNELQRDFEQEGLSLTISGLDMHRQLSVHEFATRKRSLQSLRRVTIVADAELQDRLLADIARLGASGYTLIPCVGAGRRDLAAGGQPRDSQIRIEIVAPRPISDAILDYLRRDILKDHHVTACVETVDVFKPDQF